MTDDVRRERIRAEALAQLARLQRTAEEVAHLANLAAGETVLSPRTPNILDATRPDLDRMAIQARAWLDAMQVINGWLLPRGDRRSLGALLKTLPADEVALLREHLAAAGVLPDEGSGGDRP